jgi:branched-chain amino acid transport system substrate-binding protein
VTIRAVGARIRLASLPLAAVCCLAGCGGGGDKPGDRITGSTLTIYASTPLHGPSNADGEAVVDGARLALAAMRGRIGRYRIALRVLDDSTAQSGQWDPVQTTIGARLAVQDTTTIGYIGDLNSGASAISIPVLNRAGIPQISPGSTAVGLTVASAAAAPGEPEKYYPTGIRTFARVIPNDSVQAGAQVRLQQELGCKRTYVFDDGEVDGEDIASSFVLAAQAARLQVAAVQEFNPTATDFSSLAAGVASAGADCVLITALPSPGAVLLTKQLAGALPEAPIFGSADLAESTYVDPAQGGIPESVDSRVLLTAATLDPSAYPPAGQAFYQVYRQRFGVPEPAAIFGYESMSLMLRAIGRATRRGTAPADRAQVRAAIFTTRERHSALGTYSIDPRGDTTLRTYGVYRIVGGRLVFWTAISA